MTTENRFYDYRKMLMTTETRFMTTEKSWYDYRKSLFMTTENRFMTTEFRFQVLDAFCHGLLA